MFEPDAGVVLELVQVVRDENNVVERQVQNLIVQLVLQLVQLRLAIYCLLLQGLLEFVDLRFQIRLLRLVQTILQIF